MQHSINIFVDVSAVHPFLVVGGRRCNGKIIALVPIPFRINPVQCERHNGKNVGINTAFRPSGIDFATGYIFDVILIGDIVVLCTAVRRHAIVDDDVFGYNYPR